MAVYVVGDFLRETRMRKGYTQEEVSYGICTTASLSRIENGAQKPGRLIMEKLFERLGTENNLFNTFVSREEMELYSAIQELIRNVTDVEVQKIEDQITIVEGLIKGDGKLESQIILFAQSKLAVKKYGDSDRAMELLMKAIHITLPEFDGKNPLRNNLLTFDEITIINSIAVRYAKKEEYLIAIQLDLWLKEYLENKVVDGKMKTAKYPMLLYNLSNWFGEIKCHSDALSMAEAGINFCIKYGNLTAFPVLISNKGVALAELGNIKEAKKYLHQAIVIFESMKKMEQVNAIITWCRLHYEIEF